MAVSAESVPRRYTYPDLAAFPDDHLRREIIDGELIVNAAPATRHQSAVAAILVALFNYAKPGGIWRPCRWKTIVEDAVTESR
ncbi:MAG TPA: hypothetical protein VM754_11080 [Actinomycetota bacterium]|nr:hypothetical protein [Actinomycetota bacterium]